MVYQLLIDGHKKVGQYSASSSPAKTAEKIAKSIMKDGGFKTKQEFTFEFVKNRVVEGTNIDKLYRFRARVTPLPKTRENYIQTPNGGFYKKYKIEVENLLRQN